MDYSRMRLAIRQSNTRPAPSKPLKPSEIQGLSAEYDVSNPGSFTSELRMERATAFPYIAVAFIRYDHSATCPEFRDYCPAMIFGVIRPM